MIGNYEDLVANGFDADEILQNYNKSLEQKEIEINETVVQKEERNLRRGESIRRLKTIT